MRWFGQCAYAILLELCQQPVAFPVVVTEDAVNAAVEFCQYWHCEWRDEIACVQHVFYASFIQYPDSRFQLCQPVVCVSQ